MQGTGETSVAEPAQIRNHTNSHKPFATGHVLLITPVPPPYGGMALQGRQLERLLRQDGNTVTLLPSNLSFPNGFRFLDRVRGLRPFLRCALFSTTLWNQARNVDVIHVLAASWLYFFTVVAPAALLGRLRGKRVVLNYRGGEAAEFFRWFHWAVRPVFKIATAVTTPSEFLAEVIRNYFAVPVEIVPNIVNHSAFIYRTRTSIQPKMVVARHLEKTYDIESVLKAFRHIQQQYPNASLSIAGTGSQEAYLRDLAGLWNLSGVCFLGHVPHENLPLFTMNATFC